MPFWRRAKKDNGPAKGKAPAGKSRRDKDIPVALRPSSASYWDPQPNPQAEADAAARSRVFDGATDQVFELGADAALTAVTIDLRLRSKSIPAARPPFELTTPQMPMAMVDKLGIFLVDNGYSFLLKKSAEELILKGTFGDPSKFTRITITSDEFGTALFIDGVEVRRSAIALPIQRRLRVGAGQRERFWAGEMEYCDIYRVVKVRTNFADRPGRFDDGGRIGSLQ